MPDFLKSPTFWAWFCGIAAFEIALLAYVVLPIMGMNEGEGDEE